MACPPMDNLVGDAHKIASIPDDLVNAGALLVPNCAPSCALPVALGENVSFMQLEVLFKTVP